MSKASITAPENYHFVNRSTRTSILAFQGLNLLSHKGHSRYLSPLNQKEKGCISMLQNRMLKVKLLIFKDICFPVHAVYRTFAPQTSRGERQTDRRKPCAFTATDLARPLVFLRGKQPQTRHSYPTVGCHPKGTPSVSPSPLFPLYRRKYTGINPL